MKNYLVVGGSTGIGKALAEMLSDEGHKVYATYCKTEAANQSSIEYHYLDVTEEQLNLAFVPSDLDGIAYCVGSINLMPFTRIKPKDFLSDFNLQVNGAIKVLQTVLSNLKTGKGASIVLFSSVAVQTGFKFHTQVSTSKGAVEGLTRSLAADLAPTIRVNAIAPSITDTPLAGKFLGTEDKKKANSDRHPLRRIGEPTDIASMATFLLSDKASWVTGQVIHVDGGISNIKI